MLAMYLVEQPRSNYNFRGRWFEIRYNPGPLKDYPMAAYRWLREITAMVVLPLPDWYSYNNT